MGNVRKIFLVIGLMMGLAILIVSCEPTPTPRIPPTETPVPQWRPGVTRWIARVDGWHLEFNFLQGQPELNLSSFNMRIEGDEKTIFDCEHPNGLRSTVKCVSVHPVSAFSPEYKPGDVLSVIFWYVPRNGSHQEAGPWDITLADREGSLPTPVIPTDVPSADWFLEISITRPETPVLVMHWTREDSNQLDIAVARVWVNISQEPRDTVNCFLSGPHNNPSSVTCTGFMHFLGVEPGDAVLIELLFDMEDGSTVSQGTWLGDIPEIVVTPEPTDTPVPPTPEPQPTPKPSTSTPKPSTSTPEPSTSTPMPPTATCEQVYKWKLWRIPDPQIPADRCTIYTREYNHPSIGQQLYYCGWVACKGCSDYLGPVCKPPGMD